MPIPERLWPTRGACFRPRRSSTRRRRSVSATAEPGRLMRLAERYGLMPAPPAVGW